jgi:hypothetical protein
MPSRIRQVSFDEAVAMVRLGLRKQGLKYAKMLAANLEANCGLSADALLASAAE